MWAHKAHSPSLTTEFQIRTFEHEGSFSGVVEVKPRSTIIWTWTVSIQLVCPQGDGQSGIPHTQSTS